MAKRERFAANHIGENFEWKKVIFSDEKKWNLDGTDGYRYHWALPEGCHNLYSKKSGARKSLMIWGAISYSGLLELKIYTQIADSKYYCSS